MGVGVRGRPDGRRRDRPHRPPREARPVPRRVLPRPPCPHAGGLAAQKACTLPMLRLLIFRCSFCSNPLDETQVSPRNPQAYLDWHVCLFKVNQVRDRWDPTARVVRHILTTDATYRGLGWVWHHPLSKLLDYAIV